MWKIICLTGHCLLLALLLFIQPCPPEAATAAAEIPEPVGASGARGATPNLPEGTIEIDPARQQIVGIRVERVATRAASHIVRRLGRVAPDETGVYFINATVDGWITRTAPLTTGSLVKKDEILASFYSPEFLSAGQSFLYALSSKDRIQLTGHENPVRKDQIAQFEINLQQYKDSLKNLGMGDLQIAEMMKTRRYMENVNICSPSEGFILSRKVSPGLRFEKGWEFYRIADLSRVWVLVDLYEQEAEYFPPQAKVGVTLPYRRKRYTGSVSRVLPIFEPTTRTLQVRVEVENPGFLLRPDMFVDVEIPVEHPAATFVPAEAVLDTGRSQTVFVLRGEGLFEPRSVMVGRRAGNQVEITEGLREGEQIVVSGNFLVDSESKLQSAASGMQPLLEKDPVCGREISRRKAEKEGRHVRYRGLAFHFCSEEHKRRFEDDPGAYARPPN